MTLLTEKVLGFREWNVDDDQLYATGWGTLFWVPGTNKARCLHTDGSRPRCKAAAGSEECECGLHALHAPKESWLNPAEGDTYFGSGDGRIRGAVLGWGYPEGFAVQPTGWRARFAEPVLLAYDELAGRKAVEQVHEVARLYGCHTCHIEELEEKARELGRGVPEELIPEMPPTPQGTPIKTGTAIKTGAFMALMDEVYAQKTVPKKKHFGIFP